MSSEWPVCSCTQEGSGPYTTPDVHIYPWLVGGWHAFSYSVFHARISLVLVLRWCFIFRPYMAAAVNSIFVCVILTTSMRTPRITSARLRILEIATWIMNDVYVVQVNFISTSLTQLSAFVLSSRNDYLYCVNFDVCYELHTESLMFSTQHTKPPAPLTGCRRFYTTFVAYRNTALSICVCVCVCVWRGHKCFIQRRSQLPGLCSAGGSWMKYVYGSLVEIYWQDKTEVLG